VFVSLGLLVLSKIFFKGGHGWQGRGRWKNNACKERWQKMSPEVREQMKAQWKQRCSIWRKPKTTEE